MSPPNTPTSDESQVAREAANALVARMLSQDADAEERLMILVSFYDFFTTLPEDKCYQGMRWVQNWGGTILEDPHLSPLDRASAARIVELAGERIRQIVGDCDLPA